jgi:antitoxin component of MazEF toxin-antitoxin module
MKSDKIIRKITKVGGHSYAVILPMEVVKKWGWQERQKVVIKISQNPKKITIKDWKK